MPTTVKVGTSEEKARFRALALRMKRESDGKLLRAELYGEIKTILAPAVEDVKQGFLAIASNGDHVGDPLRPAVAKNVKVGISAGSRLTGARIYVSKKGLPRGFSNAPRDLNADSWEHPGGRGGPNVTQIGDPGVFDRPLKARAREFRKAVNRAVENMARRMAGRE